MGIGTRCNDININDPEFLDYEIIYIMQYKGEWLCGKMHGRGKKTFADGSYLIGEFMNGEANGICHKYYPCGDVFYGSYEDGQRHGFGRYDWADGSTYEGHWFRDRMHGEGLKIQAMKRPEGKPSPGSLREVIFTSSHLNDAAAHGRSGSGADNGVDGDNEAINGSMGNHGAFMFEPQYKTVILRYEGDMIDDVPHGWGKALYGDGARYEGEFHRGNFHGWGRHENPLDGISYCALSASVT
jgi:hypothetical protein